MRFPFVTREHHEEVVAGLKAQVALYEAILKKHFGLNEAAPAAVLTPAAPEVPAPADPQLTPEEQLEVEREKERSRRIDNLRTIKRTRPSRLGPAMAQFIADEAMSQARNAHPSHPVNAIFEKAKDEALSS